MVSGGRVNLEEYVETAMERASAHGDVNQADHVEISSRPAGMRGVEDHGRPVANSRSTRLLVATILSTFVVTRSWLALTPDADFNVGSYNVHHLFSGIVVAMLFGIPLIIARYWPKRIERVLTVGFGIGLALVLDEWVYLIVTDGSNASYLRSESVWGGVGCVSAAVAYIVLVGYILERRSGSL